MSRFELNRAHIDGLVNAAIQFGVIAPFDDAAPTGQMLLQQHYRSVGLRADDDDPPDFALPVANHPLPPRRRPALT